VDDIGEPLTKLQPDAAHRTGHPWLPYRVDERSETRLFRRS